MTALEITITICSIVVLLAIFGPGTVKRVDRVIAKVIDESPNKTNCTGPK